MDAHWSELEAVAQGYSWERDAFGQFVLPEFTLGWAALKWADTYLLQSDGPLAGSRWTPTSEQVRILLWWYAIDREGNFLFRRGVLRRMKGWGKDPFLAVIAAIEMLGPCRFQCWDSETGEPVARPENAAWVQVAAVSKDQTRNTMTVFPGLFSKAAIAKYGIQIGKEHVFAGQNRIEAITSSPRTLEGARPTLVILNETHHWIESNAGIEQGKAIDRNLAKRPGGSARSMQITNAHVPGEDSWAEGTFEAVQDILQGKSAASGIFYDSLESNPNIDIYATDLPSSSEEEKEAKKAEIRARIAKCLEQARGGSHWLNIPRLTEEILDPQTPIEMARRFYFNQVVAAEDAWITLQQWEQGIAWNTDIDMGDTVVLGFDGSKSRDSTALVAMRVRDGLFKAIKIWERPKPPFDEGWEVPKDQVDDMVEWAFTQYNVVAFFSDVKEWEHHVEVWSVRYREQLKIKASANSMVAWDMRTQLNRSTLAAESLNAMLASNAIKHVPNGVLQRHFLNARRRPNKFGVSFGKESRESARKVDAVAATVLATLARHDYLNKEKPEKRRHGFAW